MIATVAPTLRRYASPLLRAEIRPRILRMSGHGLRHPDLAEPARIPHTFRKTVPGARAGRPSLKGPGHLLKSAWTVFFGVTLLLSIFFAASLIWDAWAWHEYYSAPMPTHEFSVARVPVPRRVMATAYCLTGVTFTGTRARKGVIAVDPEVIPLHSRVKIGKSTYLAEDTGSFIKGNHIDIWMGSCSAAITFGVQHLEVLTQPPRSDTV